MEIGLLVLRLVIGLTMVGHGAQKLFGWFGGHGLAATGNAFHGVGYRPGKAFALTAGVTEAAGGLVLALGLLTPHAGRRRAIAGWSPSPGVDGVIPATCLSSGSPGTRRGRL